MVIVEDTRNQKNKHLQLNKQLQALGVKVVRSKLYIGDYTRLDKGGICIDTKRDWDELAGNICGRQHTRFRNECIRARDVGVQLIILIEEAAPLKDWVSRKTQVKKEILQKAMDTMTARYSVIFRNCDAKRAGIEIMQILSDKE